MTLTPHARAPYTTAAAATTSLDAWRDRGLGLPITPDVLARAGVQESLARRTFQSLIDLELLHEDGRPTEQFEAFRQTRGEDEYRTRLQEWLRGVYADVLMYTDPSTDSYEAVTEAFRTYEPAGQRRAMATLLLGLWRYAGLPVPAAANGGEPNRSDRRPPARRPRQPTKAKAQPPKGEHKPPMQGEDDTGLDPGLVGLLRLIPRGKDASWTADRREAFLTAFGAVLDFSVPVVEKKDLWVLEESDEDDEGDP